MTIHQEVTIAASPEAVYGVLTSAEKFAADDRRAKSEISQQVGGTISLFGGDISGRNVELVPGKRVVQAWRSQAWPEGVYSIVKFELAAEGKGTKLVFDQAGYPEGAHDMLDGGWHQMYWLPMNAMLTGKPMAAPQM